MLVTNLLLCLVIFFLMLISGSLIEIDRKLSNEEQAKMKKFYDSLMESIRKKREKEEILKKGKI